jgi:hypothetical protein
VEHPHPAQRTGSERADPEGAGSDAARTSRSGDSDEVHGPELAEPVALGHRKLSGGAVAYPVLDADVGSAADEHAYPDTHEFPDRCAKPNSDAHRHGIADDYGIVVAHDLLVDACGDRHPNTDAHPVTRDGSANGRG